MKTAILVALLLTPLFSQNKTEAARFSDQDLNALVHDAKSSGVIYTWSPQMPYSSKAYPAIVKAAQKLGLSLTVLVDGNANPEDTAKVIERETLAESATNESETMIERGAYLHFPSVMIYAHGELLSSVILGAKSEADYEDMIQKALLKPTVPTIEDKKPVDKSEEWEVTTRMPFPHRPMYFLRPFSDGRYVPYCSNLVNWLLDLRTGESIKLRGINDPVPTPDRKYLTLPYPFIPLFPHLDFYEVKEEPRDGVGIQLKRIFRDHGMNGAYQSVSVLDSTATTSTYRVITEAMLKKGRLRLQEYTVTHRTPTSEPSVKKKFSSAQKFCPDEDLTLPMLSKTGRFLAGVDPFTRHTKVYSLDENATCTLVQDAGIISAKVDFAFDDQKYVAHVSSIDPKSVAHVVAHPSKTKMALNIVEYDWNTGEFNQLTHCTDRNCYYPSYLADGRIMYIEQYKNVDRYDVVILSRKQK